MKKIINTFNRVIKFSKVYSRKENCSYKKLALSCTINTLLGLCTIRDYFIYRFINLNTRGKKEYISNVEMLKWNKSNSSTDALGILDEKEKALIKFDAYVHRRWVGKNHHNLESDYSAFLARNSKCILKPIEGTCGHGIKIIDISNYSTKDIRELCSHDVLLEEIIVQHSSLSDLYPNAVNTIRIGTLYGEIIGATLRIGSGNAEIDNFSSGGIATNVDVSTGIVSSIGKDQYGNEYLRHPDTGVVIPGFTVPLWDKCIQFVKNMACEIPGMPFVGWDIAITSDGPVFIEANEESEIAIFQYPSNEGLRRQINTIIMQKGLHKQL